MDNKFNKIAKILAIVLGLIGAIMLGRVLGYGDDEALMGDLEAQTSLVDPFVSFTILMMYITAGAAVLFSIFNLVKSPAALKKALIGIGALAILYFIAYSQASDAEVTGAGGVAIKDGAAGFIPKTVGTLIIYTYILGVIGLLMVVWGSVRAMFSNK